jgi:hypothetical protein
LILVKVMSRDHGSKWPTSSTGSRHVRFGSGDRARNSQHPRGLPGTGAWPSPANVIVPRIECPELFRTMNALAGRRTRLFGSRSAARSLMPACRGLQPRPLPSRQVVIIVKRQTRQGSGDVMVGLHSVLRSRVISRRSCSSRETRLRLGQRFGPLSGRRRSGCGQLGRPFIDQLRHDPRE